MIKLRQILLVLTSSVSKLEGQAAGKEESDARVTVSQALLESSLYYQQGNKVEAAKALLGISRESITAEMELAFFDMVQAECNSFAANECYALGIQAFESQNYAETIIQISYARALGLINADTLYYLSRSYDLSGEIQKAKENYEQFVSEFPQDIRTEEINGYLALCTAWLIPSSVGRRLARVPACTRRSGILGTQAHLFTRTSAPQTLVSETEPQSCPGSNIYSINESKQLSRWPTSHWSSGLVINIT